MPKPRQKPSHRNTKNPCSEVEEAQTALSQSEITKNEKQNAVDAAKALLAEAQNKAASAEDENTKAQKETEIAQAEAELVKAGEALQYQKLILQ